MRITADRLWSAVSYIVKPDTSAPPLHIQIDPIRRCTLKCIHCNRGLYPTGGEMSIEVFRNIISQIPSLESINITGLGEPFLHPRIGEMLGIAKEKKLFTYMNTNFTLGKSIASKLVESRIDMVKISLDAAKTETYRKVRGTDDFPEIIRSIRLLADYKKARGTRLPIIRINNLLLSQNIHELQDMIRLAKELGVDQLLMKQVFVYDEKRRGDVLGGCSLKEIEERIREAEKIAKELGVKTNLGGLCQEMKKTLAINRGDARRTNPCPLLWLSCNILYNGDVTPCCYLWGEEAVMGNVTRERFNDIWNGERYKRFRQQSKKGQYPYDECNRCGIGYYGIIKTAITS